MKALIIYDDFTAAAKANAMLLGASAWAEEGLRWDVHPWRLEMLRPSPAGDLARAEAVDAHLIVFAVGHARSLPAELIAWLHQWALGRQVPDAALAVFESQQGGGLAAEATPELTEFARQHGLSLTVEPVAAAVDDSAALASDLQQGAAAQAGPVLGILEPPTQASHHHTGASTSNRETNCEW